MKSFFLSIYYKLLSLKLFTTTDREQISDLVEQTNYLVGKNEVNYKIIKKHQRLINKIVKHQKISSQLKTDQLLPSNYEWARGQEAIYKTIAKVFWILVVYITTSNIILYLILSHPHSTFVGGNPTQHF